MDENDTGRSETIAKAKWRTAKSQIMKMYWN